MCFPGPKPEPPVAKELNFIIRQRCVIELEPVSFTFDATKLPYSPARRFDRADFFSKAKPTAAPAQPKATRKP
jgi:hypothetical protein